MSERIATVETVQQIPKPPVSRRLLFVDIFRALAVLVMMEGHVSNSTIPSAIKRTTDFHKLDILNGMVAPSFIFIAGFAYALVLQKKMDDFLHFRKPLWLQVRRLLFILALGYWLHIPVWSLRKLMEMNSVQLFEMLKCDVLQCIALSLMFCIAAALVIRNRKVLAISFLVLGVAVVLLTPLIYDVDPNSYTHPVIGSYITATHNPLFPLFPWSAYIFLGYFFGWFFLELQKKEKDRILFFVLLPAGVLMFFGGFALFYTKLQYHHYDDPSKSSPRQFMLKLGFVFAIFSLTYFYELIRKPVKSFFNRVGQESLFVYALHLLIVYGSVFLPYSIAANVGPHLNYGASFALSGLVVSSMAICGFYWNRLKKEKPQIAKALFYAVVIYWVGGLIVNSF